MGRREGGEKGPERSVGELENERRREVRSPRVFRAPLS